MNEQEFRTRFRHALGEPQQTDLLHGLDRRLATPEPRRPLAAIGSIAGSVLILVVGGFLGFRLLSHHTAAPATVTPTTSAQPTARVIDPARCRLPVVVMRESGPPGQLTSEPGFVDTRSGQYVKDDSASIAGLPGGAFEGTDVKQARAATAAWYDEALGRWVPIGPQQIAPDGRSYAWVRLLPEGSNFSTFKTSELHRYDLTTATDHTLWAHSGMIMVSRWDTLGILVSADPAPPTAGAEVWWLIDARTGAAIQQPAPGRPLGPTMLPDEQQNGAFSWGSFGSDGHGHTLYRIGSRQGGDREWVFYESAPGQRVTIYKGIQGDSTGFDPMRAMADDTGIWFSDYEMHGIWHWDITGGLTKIVVKGLPPLLQGPNSSIYVDPAGQCM